MPRGEPPGAPVVDPGEVEGSVAVADGDPLVAKNPHAELADERDPGVGTRVVLVVAGDEVDPVAGPQRPELCHGAPEPVYGSVHEVAGDGDEVGLEVVREPHHPLHLSLADGRADVEVADLRDGEARELPGEALQLDRDLVDLRLGERAPHRPGARAPDRQHDPSGHGAGEDRPPLGVGGCLGSLPEPVPEARGASGGEAQDVHGEQRGEEQEGYAEPGHSEERGHRSELGRARPDEEHRGGHPDGCGDESEPEDAPPGIDEARVPHQARPEVEVHAAEYGDQDEQKDGELGDARHRLTLTAASPPRHAGATAAERQSSAERPPPATGWPSPGERRQGDGGGREPPRGSGPTHPRPPLPQAGGRPLRPG